MRLAVFALLLLGCADPAIVASRDLATADLDIATLDLAATTPVDAKPVGSDLSVALDFATGDTDLARPAADLEVGLCTPTIGKAPVPWGDGEQCYTVPKHPAPTTFATTIDLTDWQTLQSGLCSQYKTAREYELPKDPSAYPVKIKLPAITEVDCACDELCNSDVNGPTTAFGIGFGIGTLIGGNSDRALAIRVTSPWYFTSGGVGEANAWPCVGGYQEHGVRSCIEISFGDFAFSTHEENAPAGEAILELVDLPAMGLMTYCCPFE